MKPITTSDRSLFDLMADLRNEAKTLVRQEVELAKTEISEKASCFGRNALSIGIGAVIGDTGATLFLVGLGFLLSFAFQKLGLSAALANFIGMALIGLITAGIGYVLLSKALKTLSQSSLTPEKTLHTIKDLKGANGSPSIQPRPRPAAAKPSSAEMESMVGSTQRTLRETASELRQRLTPRYFARQCVGQVKRHPLPSVMVALSTALAGFFLARRRFWRARA